MTSATFLGLNPHFEELDRSGGRNILVALGFQAPSIRAAAGPSYFEPPEDFRIAGTIIHRRSTCSPALIRRVTSAIIRRRPRHTDRATSEKVAAVS